MSSPLDGPLARMAAMLPPMVEAGDGRRHLVAVWMRTTATIGRALERAEAGEPDGWEDPVWAAAWVAAAEDRRLEAVDGWSADGSAPGPWQIVLGAATAGATPRAFLVLLALAAHVAYDLPQALLDVLPDRAFDDDALVAPHVRDHARLDRVLLTHLEAERLLRPGGGPDPRVDARTLREARPRVWETARALSGARRQGPAVLKARVDELAALSVRQLDELRTRRPRRLRPARPSLGVALPPQGRLAGAGASVGT
ncbi:MAG: DUF5995 family protein [Planctomycetaceae bacterium]